MAEQDPIHHLDVVLHKAEERTVNGYIYPKKVLEDAARLRSLNPSRLRGELNPRTMRRDTKDKTSIAHVAESNVSHEITNMRMVGNHLLGDVEILPTPAGKLLEKVFDEGRVALRGHANRGPDDVVTSFQLISIDVVTRPSVLPKTKE